MRLKLVFLFLAVLSVVDSVPVQNGVEGEPEIECGSNSITVNFNTENDFEGSVYVKGLFEQEECRTADRGRPVTGIELGFDQCNVRRLRSLNPRGVFVTADIIITFHPLFVTKVDRAYKIQCFYMEADKTVDTRLEVSMLTTEFQTQNVPMPVCKYELLDGGPTGPIIEFAEVGQAIYHKWTCEHEAGEDIFCMIVRDCFVDDNNGDTVELVDSSGCAVDLYLLNNPEYTADLMAGVEAHVFKYADRADLYFQCQVTVLVKEPDQQCPRPVCNSPPGRGAGGSNPGEGPPVGPRPAHPFPLEPNSPYLPGDPVIGGLPGGRFVFQEPASGPVFSPPFAAPTDSFGPPDFLGGLEDPRGKRSVDLRMVGDQDVGAELQSLELGESGRLGGGAALRPNLFSRPHDGSLCFSPVVFHVVVVLLAGAGLLGLVLAVYLLLRRK